MKLLSISLFLCILVAWPNLISCQKSSNLNSYWCSACDDPHMNTFDQKRYEFQYSGDYYVMFTDYVYTMVTASFRRCNAGKAQPTCGCGAHIRFKGAYLFLDNCGILASPQMSREFYYSYPPFQNTTVKAACYDKKIPLGKETDDTWWNTPGNAVNILGDKFLCAKSDASPSNFYIRTNDPDMNKNTYLRLNVHDRGISCIYVRPPRYSYGNTHGLCGIWDDFQPDDLTVWQKNNVTGCVLQPVDDTKNFHQLTSNTNSTSPSNKIDDSNCPCDPKPRPANAPATGCVVLLSQCLNGGTGTPTDSISQNPANPQNTSTAEKHCSDAFNQGQLDDLLAKGMITQEYYNILKDLCISDYSQTGDGLWTVNQVQQGRDTALEACANATDPVIIATCADLTKPAKCLFPNYGDNFNDGAPYEPCPKTVCHAK